MRNGTVVNISGIAQPTDKVRRAAEILHGPRVAARMDQVMDDEIAVRALAGILTRAMETQQSKDGRIDMRDVAAYVLAEMRRHPK